MQHASLADSVWCRRRKCIQPIYPPSKVVTVEVKVHVRVYAQQKPCVLTLLCGHVPLLHAVLR